MTLLTEIMSCRPPLMTPLAISLVCISASTRVLCGGGDVCSQRELCHAHAQTNTLVYSAGGRKSGLPKIGAPLNLLMMITSILVIPLSWDSRRLDSAEELTPLIPR